MAKWNLDMMKVYEHETIQERAERTADPFALFLDFIVYFATFRADEELFQRLKKVKIEGGISITVVPGDSAPSSTIVITESNELCYWLSFLLENLPILELEEDLSNKHPFGLNLPLSFNGEQLKVLEELLSDYSEVRAREFREVLIATFIDLINQHSSLLHDDMLSFDSLLNFQDCSVHVGFITFSNR